MANVKISEPKKLFSTFSKIYKAVSSFFNGNKSDVTQYNDEPYDDSNPFFPTTATLLNNKAIEYNKLVTTKVDNKKLIVKVKPPKSLIDDLPDVSAVVAGRIHLKAPDDNENCPMTGEFMPPNMIPYDVC